MIKSTSRFIESIFIKNGEPLNLKWHQNRVNNTFNAFFLDKHPFSVAKTINNTPAGLQKCRITYSPEIEKIEYEPFSHRQIATLKIIRTDNFDYAFKYADRKTLESLREKKENCDDIIISIDGYLKDSSFANIVFSDGDNFYTPDPPLLYGTKRAQLLEKKKIKPIAIKETDLRNFKELHLINALADLGEYIIETKNIF